MGGSRRAFIARHYSEAKAAEFDVDPGPLEWLIELWQRTDQVRVEYGMSGGILTGLRWPDMVAWIEGAQEHDLAVVYREGIMALSAAYAQTAMAAREIGCPAPFDPGKAD